LKKYDVTLTAHYEKTISVCAESAEQAKAKTEIILFDTDLINFTDEDFICGEAKINESCEDGAEDTDEEEGTRTNVVRTVRTSVPCAENVCMRTSATSNVLPSTEFGYPNSLVRGQPLIPR